MEQKERKVLGILAIVFGGIGLLFSWVPIINNLAFIFGLAGFVLGAIALFMNRKNKKILAIIGTAISALSMVIVLVTQDSYSKALDKAVSSAGSSTETAKNNTNKEGKWSYDNDTFKTDKLTFKLGNSEVINGAGDEGTKVLVVHMDMTNDTDQEQDGSMIYAYIHANQKNDNQNISLTPGVAKPDNDGKMPFQTEGDNLHNKLLPGKTVPVVMMFELKNDRPVTLSFSNQSFKDIGTKTINVK